MKKLTTLLVAMLFTAGMAFAQSNDATIDQVGDANDADIEQLGTSNWAYVDQLAFGTASGVATFSTADIDQDGTANFVNIDQNAFYDFSTAIIEQTGTGNIVEGTTSESAWLQSNGGGLLDVYMDGDQNRLYSLRSEAQKNPNELYLDVIGDNNTVGAAQENGSGDVDIVGDLNNVTLSQIGNVKFVFNTATVDILGNENGVSVTQTMDSNSAAVNVNGSFNSATVTQN
ncbi:MAG: hypothetical protein LC687_02140 [Actinobacteria bacterium]|nr:hypothetical protein [Actinomycetota bacterium]